MPEFGRVKYDFPLGDWSTSATMADASSGSESRIKLKIESAGGSRHAWGGNNRHSVAEPQHNRKDLI